MAINVCSSSSFAIQIAHYAQDIERKDPPSPFDLDWLAAEISESSLPHKEKNSLAKAIKSLRERITKIDRCRRELLTQIDWHCVLPR